MEALNSDSASSNPPQQSTSSIQESQPPIDSSIIPLSSRHTSKVWENYTRKRVGDSIKAECNYCQKLLSGGPKAGTSHLNEHTKTCPKKRCQDLRQSRLFSVPSSVSQSEKSELTLTPYEFRQENGRKDLAEMIILHEYPLSMVEHYGFRKYSTTLQPGFKVPSRPTIKKDIFQRYEEEKRDVIQLLGKNKGRIALTTDMWTSNNQRKGYMAVTAHFIDNSWKLQSRIIRFLYVPPPHSADVLARTLLDNGICPWNIDLRLSSITLDNCTTNDAMMNILWGKLPSSTFILGGKFFHVRCCAHILNIIVQHGLSVITTAIEKVRDSVIFWTASPSRVHKFESVVNHTMPSCQKKLVIDCKTRWNSTFEMLKVAIMYKKVFEVLSGRESNSYKCAPSFEDWKMAEKICDKLELFSKVTKDFSASKHPTSNIYFGNICQIRISLNSWVSSSDEIIRDMATSMLEKYNKYWDQVNSLLGIAAILDPRHKVSLLKFYFAKIYGESKVMEEVSKIKDFLKELVEEYAPQVEGKNKTLCHKMSSTSSLSQSNGVGCVMDEYLKFIEDEDDVFEKSDLDKYLEDPKVPFSNDFDILAWWKIYGSSYPVLQMIARDILCIPISSVPSECAFSTGGRVLAPYRSRLVPSTIEALMCTQNWIRTRIEDTNEQREFKQFVDLEEIEDIEEDEYEVGISDATMNE